jgi:hypothetical protein
MNKPTPPPAHQRIEPCGCVVSENPGHIHTRLCVQHAKQYFMSLPKDVVTSESNLDLIGETSKLAG